MPSGVYKRPKPLVQRFMEKVGPPTLTGCREWTGGLAGGGYGVVRFENANVYAHVAAATAYYGPPPPKMCVCHRCDNPKCVNPAHLYIGTYQQNAHDALRRGRFGGAAKVKLFPEEMHQIILSQLSDRKIAKSLGVSPSVIRSIKKGPLVKVTD